MTANGEDRVILLISSSFPNKSNNFIKAVCKKMKIKFRFPWLDKIPRSARDAKKRIFKGSKILITEYRLSTLIFSSKFPIIKDPIPN